jgi:hypothetical protein
MCKNLNGKIPFGYIASVNSIIGWVIRRVKEMAIIAVISSVGRKKTA